MVELNIYFIDINWTLVTEVFWDGIMNPLIVSRMRNNEQMILKWSIKLKSYCWDD